MEEGMTYSFNPDDYDLKEDLKVSLIIPLYNKRKVFRRCIDSIVNQTYKNLEILIWDDCSTDDSLASIADIADPRIVRCVGTVNVGPAEARNLAFVRASGDLLGLQDADDYSNPRRIEIQLKCMAVSGRLASGCAKRYFATPAEEVLPEIPKEVQYLQQLKRITIPSIIIPREPMVMMMPELKTNHELLWADTVSLMYDFVSLCPKMYMYSLEVQDDRYSDPIKYREIWERKSAYRWRARQIFKRMMAKCFVEGCMIDGFKAVYKDQHAKLLSRLAGSLSRKPTCESR